MGSAAAYELARRGRRVLGVDQYAPPHTLGSSHGRTRIIREAYFEHPSYVPLLARAYERWEALEHDSGQRLLIRTGGLMIGAPESGLVSGARVSAETHGLPHELLSPLEVRRRFPALRPTDTMVALLEPRAGALLPERCIEAHLELAARAGAVLRTEERVLEWREDGDAVTVRTSSGSYRTDRVALCAGPWLPRLLTDARAPLQVERQLSHWFSPRAHSELFAPDRCPIALWEVAHDGGSESTLLATFPDFGDGVKVGVHHMGEPADPDRLRRTTDPAEDAAVGALLGRLLPDAAGKLRESRVCLYTNTPDQHFLIDAHPDHPRVLIVSPCSGHGFKFASVIGEIVADLVSGRESPLDLGLFRWRWAS